jgi:hypothetical protein
MSWSGSMAIALFPAGRVRRLSVSGKFREASQRRKSSDSLQLRAEWQHAAEPRMPESVDARKPSRMRGYNLGAAGF